MSDELKALTICLCVFMAITSLIAIEDYMSDKESVSCILESQKVGKLNMLEIKELCK